MKARNLLFLLVAPALLSLGGGCIFLEAPEPEPTPTPVPTPFGDQFNPAEGQPRGTALNKEGDAVFPDAFRVARALSGSEVILQSVKYRGEGENRVAVLGPPDVNNPVRLAGVIAPQPGQIGYEDSIDTLLDWTSGQDLDVDLDPRYPTDIDGRRMVHIFFEGREGGRFAGQPLSLNRMMVRSGYAIVDLYSPTSFDQGDWLFDETYARTKNPPLGLWPTNVFATLQQRPLTRPSRGTGARSTVTIETAPRPALRNPLQPGARPGTPPGEPAAPVPPNPQPDGQTAPAAPTPAVQVKPPVE